MWVKIGGMTNVEDTLKATDMGADAVGFVLGPSIRQVTVPEVLAITKRLPKSVERVGVFGGKWDLDEIGLAARVAGLTTVQMQWATISLDATQMLREELGPGISLIHRTGWRVAEDPGTIPESDYQMRSQLSVVLRLLQCEQLMDTRVSMDAVVGMNFGGFGVPFDWERARKVLHGVPDLQETELQFIVSGGLTPANVAEAIKVLGPYGVDVTTGVEQSPGRKDHGKMREFIENAKKCKVPARLGYGSEGLR